MKKNVWSGANEQKKEPEGPYVLFYNIQNKGIVLIASYANTF